LKSITDANYLEKHAQRLTAVSPDSSSNLESDAELASPSETGIHRGAGQESGAMEIVHRYRASISSRPRPTPHQDDEKRRYNLRLSNRSQSADS